jgi:hypothetical protein
LHVASIINVVAVSVADVDLDCMILSLATMFIFTSFSSMVKLFMQTDIVEVLHSFTLL